MSVSMTENWARIGGVAESVIPAEGYEEFSAVKVRVEWVEPVDDFPNLMAEAAGDVVAILMPTEMVDQLGVAAGDRVVARVRRAGFSRVFAHRQEVTVSHAGS